MGGPAKGLIVKVHSFGNLLNFHPHLHVMATDGGFTPDAVFHQSPPADEAPHARTARASWARFVKKVFAADPLECPDCGGPMRIVPFIEEQRVVRAILEHLSLWDELRPPPALPAPPCTPVELEYLPWVE